MPPSKQRQREVENDVLRLAELWEPRLGLERWEIEHVFLDTFEGAGAPTFGDFCTTAVCEVRWNYEMAKVKWYLPSAIRHDEDALERIVVHELMHIVLAPEQQLLDLELERIAKENPGEDADRVSELYYERLELATERATKVVMAGWAAWSDAVEYADA